MAELTLGLHHPRSLKFPKPIQTDKQLASFWLIRHKGCVISMDISMDIGVYLNFVLALSSHQ